LAIRSFISGDKQRSYLIVNPQSLESHIVLASEVTILKEFPSQSHLAETIARTTAPPYRLQNHGLAHSLRSVSGMFLTVDLCPSRRPFEKGLFESLAAIATTKGEPVPVAICISGTWLSAHREEIAWLKEQERQGLLAITWVNHSLTHFYDSALPLTKNFLLADGTDQRREILENEVRMLEAGLTPSLFFRSPGLVADERLVKLLHELSLIPLGADAWLAKGKEPKAGSIILVHGNGNEPQGIVKLMKPLQGPKSPLFLPLAEAVVPERDKTVDKPSRTGQIYPQ
jgi:hypothetical protein